MKQINNEKNSARVVYQLVMLTDYLDGLCTQINYRGIHMIAVLTVVSLHQRISKRSLGICARAAVWVGGLGHII